MTTTAEPPADGTAKASAQETAKDTAKEPVRKTLKGGPKGARGAAPRRIKLTRAERNELTRQKLYDAARKVVGRLGYAEASIARITAEAGVAQGTFYNYFATRQELLDELLPETGKDMLEFIRVRTRADVPQAMQEEDRFRAFFEYLKEVPEFIRILNEAEMFAPAGYRRHIDIIANSYARLLRRGRDKGEVQAFSDEEIEVVVHMLMGARGYLSQRYVYAEDAAATVPDHVLSAYGKLLSGGLFPSPAAPPACATAPNGERRRKG